MKIAVTAEGDQVFQHFGKCPSFAVFFVEGGEIRKKEILDAEGNGHAALGGFLKSAGVDVVICGGIGDGAKNMLAAEGIQLVSGIEGPVEDAVHAYLTGNLTDQGGGCNHEDYGRDHDCNCENHPR